jgi:predicted Zn finger-like uncharacterized protein
MGRIPYRVATSEEFLGMPISVTCPGCNATFRVADEVAGRAIKCKQCGARVAVTPGDGDEARVNDDSGDDETGANGSRPRARKKGGPGRGIAIVAGALVGACCICSGIGGGVGYWVWTKPPSDKDAQKGVIANMNKDKAVLAAGPTIFDTRDTLRHGDFKAALRRPAKDYKVKLEANKEYVIDMKAEKQELAHNPFLILLDPQNRQVAQDDDSGGGLDAQIVYRPTSAGEYTIQAICPPAVPPGGMPFHLTVKLKAQ